MIFAFLVEYWVEAVAGGRAELPCSLHSETRGDEVFLVLWYKNESGTPVYT